MGEYKSNKEPILYNSIGSFFICYNTGYLK